MSYAPGFSADVFISFGEAAEADASWLVGFKSTLVGVLRAQLKDRQLDPVVYASGADEPHRLSAADAAVLVAVLSPGSEFADDLGSFLAASEGRPGGTAAAGARLFRVVRRPVTDEPEQLGKAPAFEYKPEDDGNPVKSGQATMELGALVAESLEELRASALTDAGSERQAAERIKVTAWLELQAGDEPSSPETPASERPIESAPEPEAAGVATDKPYIFILHSAEDAAAVLPLKAYLESEGRYEVGCSADFAGDARDTQAVQEAFDIFASECDACLLFYGNAGAEWVTSTLKKFAQAQDRRPAGRDILARTLLCIPPGAPEKSSQADPPRMGSVQFVRYAAEQEVFEVADLTHFLEGLGSTGGAADA